MSVEGVGAGGVGGWAKSWPWAQKDGEGEHLGFVVPPPLLPK
jgi:hypothetical protein